MKYVVEFFKIIAAVVLFMAAIVVLMFLIALPFMFSGPVGLAIAGGYLLLFIAGMAVVSVKTKEREQSLDFVFFDDVEDEREHS